MYMLPLRFVKIGKDMAICATRIVALMTTEAYQARRVIKDEKIKGTLINAAGNLKCETAVFLDNGTVIASPYKVDRILKGIERSNLKSLECRNPREGRLKVYDVADEEPDEENDENMSEISIEELMEDDDIDQSIE